MVVAYQRSVGTTFVSILHRFRYITTFAYVTVTLRSPSVLIRQLKLQVTFSFRFACKHIVNNTCHIFRNIKFRQVLNSWNDLQSHSRTLMTEDPKKLHWYKMICSSSITMENIVGRWLRTSPKEEKFDVFGFLSVRRPCHHAFEGYDCSSAGGNSTVIKHL